jgi:hypothetical protein
MISVRKIVFAAAVALGFAASESKAQAQCNGPMCNGQGRPSTLGQFLGKGGQLPVYQAAPWYLYWPYDAHFQTPAPVQGAWYGPPNCRAPMNPYFPAPAAYGYGPPPAYGFPPPPGYGAPTYGPVPPPPTAVGVPLVK